MHVNIVACISLGSLACGRPQSVNHATVSVTTKQMANNESLQIATYTCDSRNGYATRGNNTIACLKMHGYSIWTSVQVTCTRMYALYTALKVISSVYST